MNSLKPKAFLQKIQSADNPIIVDVRTPDEFTIGHIEYAINISYLNDDFWENMGQLDSSKDVLSIGRTGRGSVRACTLMRNGGFDYGMVFNLEGGYPLWLEKIK